MPLVGAQGAVSVGTAGTAVTPAWGAGASRTANNLLVLQVASTGSATLPAAISGWTIAKQQAGTTCSASIYVKVATGADAAPTVPLVASAIHNAMLSEFSGLATATPVEFSGGAAAITTPIVGTCGGTDANIGNLVVGAAAVLQSAARTNTLAHTINNGVTDTETSNAATSTVSHYDFTYGFTTSQSGADSDSFAFVTTQLTGAALAVASLKVLSVAGTRSVPDTMTMTDAVTTQVDRSLTLADTPALADAVTRQADWSLTVADTPALADAATPLLTPAASVPVDPPDPTVTGCVGWYKADSITVADGALVTAWADSSGSGRNLVQNTVGRQPTFVKNVVNGRPVVRGGGSQDIGGSGFAPLSVPLHVFAVLNKGGNRYCGFADTSVRFGGDHTIPVQTYAGAGFNGNSYGHLPVQFRLVAVAYTGTAATHSRVDRVDDATGDMGSNSPGTTFAILSDSSGASPQYYVGDVAEILVYDHVLSPAEIANVEDYLQAKYWSTPPGGVAGVAGWWAADTVGQADGSSVTTWMDSAPMGKRHLTSQGGPTFRTGVVNGKPVMRMDGVDDEFYVANLPAFTGLSGFAVFKKRVANTYGALWQFGAGTGDNHFPYSSQQIYDDFGASLRKGPSSSVGLLMDKFYIYTAISAASDWRAYVDNALVLSDPANVVQMRAWNPGPNATRAGLGRSTGGNFFDGDIAEVVIYDHALTDTDRGKVQDYLVAKYFGAPAATNFTVPLADTMTLADARSTVLGWDRTFTDALTMADARAFVLDYVRALADTATMAEQASPVVDRVLALADSMAMVTATATGLDVSKTLTEVLTLGDAAATAVTWVRTQADPLTMADVATPSLILPLTLADTFTVLDAPATALNAALAFTDALVMGDSQSTQLDRLRTFADALAMTEAAAPVIIRTATMNDTLTLADAQAFVTTWARAMADPLSLADLITPAASGPKFQAIADTLAMADLTARAVTYERSLADTLSIAEGLSHRSDQVLELAEDLTVLDVFTWRGDTVRLLEDVLTFEDAVNALVAVSSLMRLRVVDRALGLVILGDHGLQFAVLSDRALTDLDLKTTKWKG
jgi:hypothetical protein